MIMRIWLIVGVLLGGLAWVLLVPFSPAPFQASPGTSLNSYRASGQMPQPGQFRISEELGHEIFEVPATDAEHFAAAQASGGGMPGMSMGEMGGETHDEGKMPGMTMPETSEGDAHSGNETPGIAMPKSAEVDAHDGDETPGKTMPESGEGEAHGSEAEHGETPMTGMAMEGEREHADGFGLALVPDQMAHMAGRTIEIKMAEWGFSPAKVTVAADETVRFVVRNTGNLPHEFMFMPAAGMMAVNYRLQRADWNLTEHEAIFERAVVLPGDSFDVVLKIEQPGTWMFMCMFPYHMQFGMMGTLATEGGPTEGGMIMDGEMKM